MWQRQRREICNRREVEQMTPTSWACPVMLISLGGATHDQEVPKSRPGGCRCPSVFILVLHACMRVPSRTGCKRAQPSLPSPPSSGICQNCSARTSTRSHFLAERAQLLLPSPFPHAPGKIWKQPATCHLPGLFLSVCQKLATCPKI